MPMSLHAPGLAITPPGPHEPALPQVGVLPYARIAGDIAFLLITSRGTGKWLFPKGAPIEGLSAWEAAACEAREEAGISGTIDNNPIGLYRDWKTRKSGRIAIEVTLFPMQVEQQFEDWHDSRNRHRHWAIHAEACKLLINPELIALMTRFHASLK